MSKQKQIHIFVDTSPKMYEEEDGGGGMAIDRVNEFLLYMAEKGDGQPAYMHRVYIHVGDTTTPLEVGRAEEKIRESRNLIYTQTIDEETSRNLWTEALKSDKPANNLIFILTTAVRGETLEMFKKYEEKLMFLDFSGQELPLADEQKERVHVIGSERVEEFSNMFHIYFLYPYITEVNFGISMKSELLTIDEDVGKEKDEKFQLSEFTVIGTTSWKTMELLPILSKCFIVPIDECYNERSSKIKSVEAYNILKELLEPEPSKPELQNPGTSYDVDTPGGVKKSESTESERSQESIENELRAASTERSDGNPCQSEELPKPILLYGCAKDRSTRIRRPVILRLLTVTKNDNIIVRKNVDSPDAPFPKLEDVDYRNLPKTPQKKPEDVDYRSQKILDSPASPDGPASPDASPGTSSRLQMPKIIPVDRVEEIEAEEPKSPDYEDMPTLEAIKLIPLESIVGDSDDVEDSEDVIVEEKDEVRIEVIVLKMTWDAFVETSAFADDSDEIEKVVEEGKIVEEPVPTYLHSENPVGWYTAEAVQYHIQKLHKATRKLFQRQEQFDSEVDNMLKMVEYSQNPQMALRLADAIRDDKESLVEEDEEIVEEAAKKFDKMYEDMRRIELRSERSQPNPPPCQNPRYQGPSRQDHQQKYLPGDRNPPHSQQGYQLGCQKDQEQSQDHQGSQESRRRPEESYFIQERSQLLDFPQGPPHQGPLSEHQSPPTQEESSRQQYPQQAQEDSRRRHQESYFVQEHSQLSGSSYQSSLNQGPPPNQEPSPQRPQNQGHYNDYDPHAQDPSRHHQEAYFVQNHDPFGSPPSRQPQYQPRQPYRQEYQDSLRRPRGPPPQHHGYYHNHKGQNLLRSQGPPPMQVPPPQHQRYHESRRTPPRHQGYQEDRSRLQSPTRQGPPFQGPHSHYQRYHDDHEAQNLLRIPSRHGPPHQRPHPRPQQRQYRHKKTPPSQAPPPQHQGYFNRAHGGDQDQLAQNDGRRQLEVHFDATLREPLPEYDDMEYPLEPGELVDAPRGDFQIPRGVRGSAHQSRYPNRAQYRNRGLGGGPRH